MNGWDVYDPDKEYKRLVRTRIEIQISSVLFTTAFFLAFGPSSTPLETIVEVAN